MARRLLATLNDTTLFLQSWLAHPKRTAAVAPSSRSLANAMARWLPPNGDGYVLELGPGTGAVTQALINRGLAQERLIAIEKNPKMARVLRERFPRAHVITGDACCLDRLLQRHLRPVGRVDAVISSLPLRHFPPAEAERLARKIRAILQPGGRWVQYSYHLGEERPRGTNYFHLITSDVIWLNLPPAKVSVYQKQAPFRHSGRESH
jgi:phosphatidylethanolamine/phosphatidyl-N-methylethanolamine N-methyltransferase